MMGVGGWQALMVATTVTVEAVTIEGTASTGGHIMFPETFSDHRADWCNGFAVLELVDSGRRETHTTPVCWSCPEKKIGFIFEYKFMRINHRKINS